MVDKLDVWCVVLASREIGAILPGGAPDPAADSSRFGALTARDPLENTLRRAHHLSARATVGAVVSARGDLQRQSSISQLPPENIFVQPDHRGTAYEVLLALLGVGARISPDTPIVFLPSDHVVSDEEVITSSLSCMAEWMERDPGKVYLLGAVPEGPHDQLGYIVPWYDALHMASGVYEFVEEPDVREARKLINAGGLWNTFIFGGTWSSLLALYRARFEAVIKSLQAAHDVRSNLFDMSALTLIYDGLIPADFSKDILVPQTHRLSVLRMPRCGWWPLKSPTRSYRVRDMHLGPRGRWE